MEETEEAFKKYVKIRKIKHGHRASCILGYFDVEGEDRERVLSEARHYFWQYYADGEYDHR